ncbi:MAG: sporulation membrane protein YtaF [Bacillota bacterium]|nr:sporulation membrane protein YtaF [Bacillota bacterium]
MHSPVVGLLHLFLDLLLFALATNADNLVAGVAYAARGIRIGWTANAVISLMGGLTMAGGMLLGSLLGGRLSAGLADRLGGALLTLIGLASLVQSAARRLPEEGTELRLARLGLVIRILRYPEEADRDLSGRIEGGEVLLLGAALSANNVAAGAGAGLMGLPVVPAAAATALTSALALLAGRPLLRLGRRWSLAAEWSGGLLLLALGLINLLGTSPV